MPQKRPKNIASVGDRIRGSIAALLCIASWTAAGWTNDNQWLVAFMVAGYFFLLTTVAYVFDKYDPSSDEEDSGKF